MKNLKPIIYLCTIMMLLSFSVQENSKPVTNYHLVNQQQTVSVLLQFPPESSLEDRLNFRMAFSYLFGKVTVQKCFGSDDSEVWLVPSLSQEDFAIIYSMIVAELNDGDKTTGDRKKGDDWRQTTKGFTMTYGGQCN